MSDESIKFTADLDEVKSKKALDKLKREATRSGEQAGQNISKGIDRGLSATVKLAIGAAAAIASAFGARAAIRAANAQEDAVNSLNASLAATGKFSQETSRNLQDFASELQSVTRFGDEVILENQALIQSLGDLDEEGLKRATTASADLATALGVDLRTASQLVGRAAQGQIGTFTRYGVAIQQGANDTETFNNALQAIEQRFGGRAQRDVQTFSGVTAQLGNTFGDIAEQVGFFITQTPEVTLVLQGVKNSLEAVLEAVTEFRQGFNLTEDLLLPLLNVADAISNTVVPGIELGFNLISAIIIQGIQNTKASLQTLVVAFTETAALIARGIDAIDFTGKFAGINQDIQNFNEASNEVLEEFRESATGIFDDVFDFPVSETLARKTEELQEALIFFNAEAKQGLEEQENTFSDIADNIGEKAQQTAQIIQSNLTRGISGGIQTVINSLAQGENAFQAFAGFALNTFGDLAIQLGQAYIGIGLGVEALNAVSGAGAIAAGVGLVAVGSIMKAFAGSGGTVSSPTSTGGQNFAPLEPPTPVTQDPTGIQARQERAGVNLTIQGDVFDSDETGTRIASVLSRAAGNEGLILRDTRLA